MALNPFQAEIEKLAKSMNLKGSAQQRVYNTPQFMDLVQRFYGNIPLPAGINESMVKSRSASGLEYTDPEGYVHQLVRNLNGVDPRLGEVSEKSTNRPAVLPLGGQQQTQLNTLQNQLNQVFTNPFQLANIDPQSMQALAAMAAAEDQALKEAFQRAQGTTVAQLVGQGVGSSSIAGDLMGKLLQDQGLVQSQTKANQASRELGVRQFLSQGQQQQNQNLQQFVSELLGLGTQRDIASGQLGVQREGMNLQNEQFFKQLQETIRQFDEQLRMQERQSFINNLFKGVAAGTGIATGIGGLFNSASGSGSAFGGNSLFLTPPINPYGNRPNFGNVNA